MIRATTIIQKCGSCGSAEPDCGHREPELVIHYLRLIENFERRRLARLESEVTMTRQLLEARRGLEEMTTRKETTDAVLQLPERKPCAASPLRIRQRVA